MRRVALVLLLAGCVKKDPGTIARTYVDLIRTGKTEEARKMHCPDAPPNMEIHKFSSSFEITGSDVQNDRACVEGSVTYEGLKGSSVAFDVWDETGGRCIRAVRIYGSCKPSP